MKKTNNASLGQDDQHKQGVEASVVKSSKQTSESNFRKIGKVVFPEFSGIDIYMMPIIPGDKDSIPDEYQKYFSLIEACKLPSELKMEVAYLTIKESLVKAGETHKQKGIHLDLGGRGFHQPKVFGNGIYLANTVEKSCRIFNEVIEDYIHNKEYNEYSNGNCESLRNALGSGKLVKADTLYCLHELCPHESLPVKTDIQRQFFRLIVGKVRYLNMDNCTRNPKGIYPHETVKKIGDGYTYRQETWGNCW